MPGMSGKLIDKANPAKGSHGGEVSSNMYGGATKTIPVAFGHSAKSPKG